MLRRSLPSTGSSTTRSLTARSLFFPSQACHPDHTCCHVFLWKPVLDGFTVHSGIAIDDLGATAVGELGAGGWISESEGCSRGRSEMACTTHEKGESIPRHLTYKCLVQQRIEDLFFCIPGLLPKMWAKPAIPGLAT